MVERRIIGFTELREKYLPHGYPLLMVDRVLDYRENDFINALKCVTGNAPDTVGHFPKKRTIMAGTNIVQSFSQLAIVLFQLSNGRLADDEMTLVNSVAARFIRPVFPGDTLNMTLRTRQLDATTGIFTAEALVDGNVVTRGRLTLTKVKSARFENAPW